jgi:hypothetical protein
MGSSKIHMSNFFTIYGVVILIFAEKLDQSNLEHVINRPMDTKTIEASNNRSNIMNSIFISTPEAIQ